MRILITGGLGFIGSHLAERLLARSHQLCILDDLSSNVSPVSAFALRCNVVIADIGKIGALNRQFDVIFHFASIVGPLRVLQYPTELEDLMRRQAQAVARFASLSGARLIFSSSSDVYGAGGWLTENDPPCPWSRRSPRAGYAAGKLAAEEVIADEAARVESFKYGILRFFNIAGPKQFPRGGFVIARMIEAALSNKPLTIYGDGTQKRCFLHVLEAVDACERLLNSGGNAEILNIGNPGNLTSIRSLAQRILRLAESSSTLDFVDAGELYGADYDDGFDKLPVIAKATSLLQWHPSKDLETIILDAIAPLKTPVPPNREYPN